MPTLLDKLRSGIKSIEPLHTALRPAVHFVRRIRGALEMREINRFRSYCRKLALRRVSPTFVKVGANDGVTGDPCSDILLSGTTWRGLLIEPVPYCFERLKRNFHDTGRFALERVAIGAQGGAASFYYVDAEAARMLRDLPLYFDQLGSFNKAHILKHLDARLQPFIVESEVAVAPLSEVIERNGLTEIDLLHVDCEGYDLEVLRTLDFERHSPSLIFIEHKHLTESDRAAMLALLAGEGFRVRDCGGDYFALNLSRFKA